MIEIKEKGNCCGCNACVQACPQKCISMVEDTEGFDYPQVDVEKCIQCENCKNVCPILHFKEKQKDNKGYVAYATDDEIRMKSSSGGIFTLLAESVLAEGGIVFGVAFDDEFMVHHIAVTKQTDLSKLRGSKYTQSRIENTFKEAKEALDTGVKVLFTGTACQIAGLNEYLKKEYANLLTVDILCHGVPSPKVWKHYLREQERDAGVISNINFRDKSTGWKRYSLEILYSDSKEYRKEFFKDSFLRLFLSNICLRKSCYECKFKGLNRPSDITLGDCWGIKTYMPEMDDDKGTSVVLVHSVAGEEMVQSIVNKVKMREAEIDTVLPPTVNARKSPKCHSKREEFFKRLNEGESITDLVKLIDDTFMMKVKRNIRGLIGK